MPGADAHRVHAYPVIQVMDDYQITRERIVRCTQWVVCYRGVPIGSRKSYHLAVIMAEFHHKAMRH